MCRLRKSDGREFKVGTKSRQDESSSCSQERHLHACDYWWTSAAAAAISPHGSATSERKMEGKRKNCSRRHTHEEFFFSFLAPGQREREGSTDPCFLLFSLLLFSFLLSLSLSLSLFSSNTHTYTRTHIHTHAYRCRAVAVVEVEVLILTADFSSGQAL